MGNTAMSTNTSIRSAKDDDSAVSSGSSTRLRFSNVANPLVAQFDDLSTGRPAVAHSDPLTTGIFSDDNVNTGNGFADCKCVCCGREDQHATEYQRNN